MCNRAGKSLVLHTAEFALLQFVTPDGRFQPIAVLVLDHEGDKLYVRARRNLGSIVEPEDARVLRLILSQLAEEANATSGSVILENLESTLSNAVRITKRAPVELADFDTAVDELYTRYVPSAI